MEWQASGFSESEWGDSALHYLVFSWVIGGLSGKK